jgi:hypothetical protein
MHKGSRIKGTTIYVVEYLNAKCEGLHRTPEIFQQRRMLHTAEMNTKKLSMGCGAAEAPRPVLDSTANSGLVWGMDVVNWTLLLVRLSGGDRNESTCSVPLLQGLFNSTQSD